MFVLVMAREAGGLAYEKGSFVPMLVNTGSIDFGWPEECQIHIKDYGSYEIEHDQWRGLMIKLSTAKF